MKIIGNHFEGKTTYIIGNFINNGCQTFHKDNAKEIFDKFKVPNQTQEEVLSYCDNNEDYETLSKSDNSIIKALTALNGYKTQELINDKDAEVRKQIARYNNPDILKQLLNDEDRWVRHQIAIHNNPDILDHLLNDSNAEVRQQAQKTIDKYTNNNNIITK